MALPKIVAEWDWDSGKTLTITNAELSTWTAEETNDYNDWFKKRKGDGDYAVTFNGDMHLITRVKRGRHIFQGAPDARQAATSPAPEAGPFRRRYRALTPEQVALHDAIKDKATELWALYDEVMKSPNTLQPADRDIELARTHLEDSVMRAVRALTA